MKNKGGRPSKYDTIDNDQVLKLYQKGFTDEEIADFFGIARQTIYNWKEKNPEFLDIVKKGKDDADDQVKQALFKRAIGFTNLEERAVSTKLGTEIISINAYYPPDVTSCIFWLTNRRSHEWKRNPDTAIDGKVTVEIVRRKKGDTDADQD